MSCAQAFVPLGKSPRGILTAVEMFRLAQDDDPHGTPPREESEFEEAESAGTAALQAMACSVYIRWTATSSQRRPSVPFG
jgi:hypothetical protein